jgi:hypothetical protein
MNNWFIVEFGFGRNKYWLAPFDPWGKSYETTNDRFAAMKFKGLDSALNAMRNSDEVKNNCNKTAHVTEF